MCVIDIRAHWKQSQACLSSQLTRRWHGILTQVIVISVLRIHPNRPSFILSFDLEDALLPRRGVVIHAGEMFKGPFEGRVRVFAGGEVEGGPALFEFEIHVQTGRKKGVVFP